MDQRTSISPEVTHKKRTQRSLFYRATLGLLDIFSLSSQKTAFKEVVSSCRCSILCGGMGKDRLALVNLLLHKFKNPAYLEIGCASNFLFDSVPISNNIGVDPFSGGTIRKTSDAFFESNCAHFDVIFIDGLHTYEQVRRDVIHSIQSLNIGGWIALHDMLPRNWLDHPVPVLSTGA